MFDVYCLVSAVQVSFITDDDEFNRDDDPLHDEFSAIGKKHLSPDPDFSTRLSDAETFKGISRHSSVSADDDDEDLSEKKDSVFFMLSSVADTDRCDER